jgi:putative salt-induced outer membrane protein
MKLHHTSAIAALTLAMASSVLAQAPQPKPFEGSVALGYVGTTGNTDTATFNTEVLATLRSADWTHNGKFQALGSQENSNTKAERYFLEDKSDYNLDMTQYLFVKGSYLDDRFSGYHYQATAAAGYGRYLFKQGALSLQVFGGAGYRNLEDIQNVVSDDAIVTAGEKLAWKISDSAKLVQNFTADAGGGLTSSVFELGLESQIIGNIATKIAFQARNLSQVPVGKKKTDTQTSISLVYAF